MNAHIVDGIVLHAGQSRDANGVPKMTVSCMYKVHDLGFYASETFTFMSERDAERAKSRCEEGKLRVRYQRDQPEICVLDRDGI